MAVARKYEAGAREARARANLAAEGTDVLLSPSERLAQLVRSERRPPVDGGAIRRYRL